MRTDVFLKYLRHPLEEPFNRNKKSDPHPGGNLLLESNDFMLLEDDNAILLEQQ